MLKYVASVFSIYRVGQVDSNKLCHNVQNEVTLICIKFDADLINISKATGHKTKCPRFLA